MAPPRRSGRKRSQTRVTEDALGDSEFEPDLTSSTTTSDSNAFLPDDEAQPRTKKRALKQPLPVQKRARAKTPTSHNLNTSPVKISNLTPQRMLPELGHLRLKVSDDTPLLLKWQEALPNLRVEEIVRPTRLELSEYELEPLEQLPDIPGRQFDFQIESVDLDVNWDPEEGDETSTRSLSTQGQIDAMAKYYKVQKTWRIHVWDCTPPDGTMAETSSFP